MLLGSAAGGRFDPATCLLWSLCTVCGVFMPLGAAAERATVSGQGGNKGQITYSSGPFRGSEAYRDACRSTPTNPRLLTGATVGHTHTHFHLHPQSLSLVIP